jgi:chromosome segregation ATPase
MAMQSKLFTFNASSFNLDARVEEFLRTKGAVSLDFGASAYINSEAMPAVLSELLEKSSKIDSSAAGAGATVAQLRAELGRFSGERQKLMEDNARLVMQIKSLSTEAPALKEQIASLSRTVDALRAENSRLATASKIVPATQQPATMQDDKFRQSYEKLVREFQDLRSQNIEAITSVKVLEEENEDLREEIDALRAHAKNAPPAKAG